MIEKLESAGLGFYVRATETQQKLGTYANTSGCSLMRGSHQSLFSLQERSPCDSWCTVCWTYPQVCDLWCMTLGSWPPGQKKITPSRLCLTMWGFPLATVMSCNSDVIILVMWCKLIYTIERLNWDDKLFKHFSCRMMILSGKWYRHVNSRCIFLHISFMIALRWPSIHLWNSGQLPSFHLLLECWPGHSGTWEGER